MKIGVQLPAVISCVLWNTAGKPRAALDGNLWRGLCAVQWAPWWLIYSRGSAAGVKSSESAYFISIRGGGWQLLHPNLSAARQSCCVWRRVLRHIQGSREQGNPGFFIRCLVQSSGWLSLPTVGAGFGHSRMHYCSDNGGRGLGCPKHQFCVCVSQMSERLLCLWVQTTLSTFFNCDNFRHKWRFLCLMDFSQGTKLTEAPQFASKGTGSFHVVKQTIKMDCVFIKMIAIEISQLI